MKLGKQCYKCREYKLLMVEFWYKNKMKKDGFDGWCKSCRQVSEPIKLYHRKYDKEYRQTKIGKESDRRGVKKYSQTEKGKETRKRYKQSDHGRKAIVARIAVYRKVKTGKIRRPSELKCHYCSSQAEQYHHHLGYEKENWLSVIPVCKICHLQQ